MHYPFCTGFTVNTTLDSFTCWVWNSVSPVFSLLSSSGESKAQKGQIIELGRTKRCAGEWTCHRLQILDLLFDQPKPWILFGKTRIMDLSRLENNHKHQPCVPSAFFLFLLWSEQTSFVETAQVWKTELPGVAGLQDTCTPSHRSL